MTRLYPLTPRSHKTGAWPPLAPRNPRINDIYRVVIPKEWHDKKIRWKSDWHRKVFPLWKDIHNLRGEVVDVYLDQTVVRVLKALKRTQKACKTHQRRGTMKLEKSEE